MQAEQREKQRIPLRGNVGTHEFHTALDCVTAGSDPVLDFLEVRHIDYRAARDFAQQLRRARRMVRVVGLDDYCSQILRFAWTAEDWERLQVVGEELDPSALRSNLLVRGEISCGAEADSSPAPLAGVDSIDGMQVFAEGPSGATTGSLAPWEAMATWTSGDWETVWSCS